MFHKWKPVTSVERKRTEASRHKAVPCAQSRPGAADGCFPILNGEFCWCSGHFLDWGRFLREERFTREEMAEIAVRGQVSLEHAFTHPSLIGYTWFKWYTGIEFTSNEYGLATDQPFGAVVNNRGELNVFNQPLFRAIHARLDGIAACAIPPIADPGLGPVPQTDKQGRPLVTG